LVFSAFQIGVVARVWTLRSFQAYQARAVLEGVQVQREFQGLMLDGAGIAALMSRVLEHEAAMEVRYVRVDTVPASQTFEQEFAAAGRSSWASYFPVFEFDLNSSHHHVRLGLQMTTTSVWTALMTGALASAAVSFLFFVWLSLSRANLAVKDSQQRAEWAAGVIHDLKGPMFALKTVENGLRPDQAELGEIVRTCLARVEAIARDLAPDKESGTRVEQVCKETAVSIAREASVPLSIFIFDTRRLIKNAETSVDPAQVKRVLENIFRNALEASRAGSAPKTIEVRLESRDSLFVQVAISNSGPVIPCDLLNRLGREQVNSSKANGSGLGLFSSRELIERWGGKMNIQSPRAKSDLGTSVTFSLPLIRLS